MPDRLNWQNRVVARLSRLFEKDPDVQAFVLSGSLAKPEGHADVWSDVDVKIILVDHVLDRYHQSTEWLAPFGQILGVEKHVHPLTRTLRVCLDSFQRIDLTFIAASAVRPAPAVWPASSPELIHFHPSDRVVWSRLPELEARVAALPVPVVYQEVSDAEIDGMADAFWFKAAVATAKVVRNDLLIGFHLALDLARTCLVLQMIRRDRRAQTTIHRTGGWGNEVVECLFPLHEDGSTQEILSLIQRSCEVFDELALQLSSNYSPRGHLLFPSIEAARNA